MSHRSGLKPLAFATLSILDPHENSSQISCYLCEALILWERSLHVVQQFIDGVNVEVAHSSPGAGPGWQLYYSDCQFSCAHASKASSQIFAQARDMGSSLVWGRWKKVGLALIRLHYQGQLSNTVQARGLGQLAHILQVVRYTGVSLLSYTLYSWYQFES